MDPKTKAVLIFFFGLVAFGLFVWYFAADNDKKKRLAGSLLSALLIALGIYTIAFEKLKKGIDLEGGAAFLVKIRPAEGKNVTKQEAERAKEIIEKRLAPLGNKDIVVTVQGEDQIYVEVPGIDPKEIDENRQIIEKVAKLEFKLVHPNSRELIAAREDAVWDPVKKVFIGVREPGWEEVPRHERDDGTKAAVIDAKVESRKEGEKLSRDEQVRLRLEKIYKDKQTIVINRQAELSGKSVKQAWAATQPGSGNFMIHVNLYSDYGDKMEEITKNHTGEPLAIVVDNEVISAPNINGVFGDRFEITGSFSQQEAEELAGQLMNPLEHPLEIIQASQTSPTYGESVIKQGMLAGAFGLLATFVFMMIYYRVSGIVAVVGLVVNLILLMAAMVVFDFTLTMPGIAGIVLTLGVAVDANVLIYERMREELAAGKTFSGALGASYSKAFSAIFDSNLTGLITSVIMVIVATGAIKGFGVTLTIGILASLFSALLITRVCFGWLQSLGLKKVSFLNLVSNRLYDFMGQRKLWLLISGFIIAGCVATLMVKGEKSLGYELRGGDLVSIQGVTEAEVADSLKDVTTVTMKDGKTESFSFTLQSIKPLGDQSGFVNVRTNFGFGATVQAELQKDLGSKIKTSDVQQIGPTVGKEMLIRSGWALFWGMVGIFVYLTFRYEVPFAIGGIVALVHDVVVAAGVCVLTGHEISMILVGALLTIAGYSINDTIVIFDRIREQLRTSRSDLPTIMNEAISATLSRTILTSGVTLFVVLSMYFFGGPSMVDFSFCMLIGMISGVYSTIFIASPVVLWWANFRKLNLRKAILDADIAKLSAQSNIEREAPKNAPAPKPKEA